MGDDIDGKSNLLYEYTYDSLETLLDAGVNVGMVQVGNETNGAFCGEAVTNWYDLIYSEYDEGWENIVKLFQSGSDAIHDISSDYGVSIKVALHFSNLMDDEGHTPSFFAELLDKSGVDYDVLGISYYMYRDGTLEDLADEMSTIYKNYGKEVFIAETAYPYTSEDYDGSPNVISSFDDFDYNKNLYVISEAGQEAALTAILDTAAATEGCIGMFYWEPAWTALDYSTYSNGTGS